MNEIENFADMEIGDVLIIGCGGKETRHVAHPTNSNTVTLQPPFGLVTEWHLYDGSPLSVMHKVGALRILRPDPPFSVEFEATVDEDGAVKGTNGGMRVFVEFSGPNWETMKGHTLRVRIDEVRP